MPSLHLMNGGKINAVIAEPITGLFGHQAVNMFRSSKAESASINLCEPQGTPDLRAYLS